MPSTARKRPSRLGRGLSSLMAQSVPATPPPTEPPTEPPAEPTTDDSASSPEAGAATPPGEEPGVPTGLAEDPEAASDQQLRYIGIDRLRPNPHQPRQHFDPQSLQRLADSIQADGLMQPIVVRPAEPAADDAAAESQQGGQGEARFEIVAGERRWRAAKLAGLEQVPAIVRELDDQSLAEWALIENLQREDLNPIERAEAFQALADRFGLGHDAIARRLGLERSTVSNLLRLLRLSDFAKDCVREGALSMGQARAIAGVADVERQRQLAQRAIKQGLSVRQVEQLARQAANGNGQGDADPATAEPTRGQVRSAYLADLEQQLAEQLQTRVKVRPGRKKGSGTLTIEFYSLDQFDALMEKLGVSAAG